MKNHFWVSFVILTSLACAQTSPAPKSSPSVASSAQSDKDRAAQEKPVVPVSNVGPDDAVITIPGECATGTPADSCVTKITRAQFEALVNAMNPNTPLEARRSIAMGYGQLVAVSTEAQKRGVDKDPNLQIQLKVQAMSLMAQGLQKKVFETSKPTEQEIETYRTENAAKYEEIKLRRIVVLKSTSSELKPEELKALADKVRERAAAGEDTDKLEIEAYKTTKTAGTPPKTDLGWKKHGMMDGRHEAKILLLKPGEVSPVLEDGQAFYIYKVEDKRSIPLDTVKAEIEKQLQVERAQKTMKQLADTIKPQLNDAYFGPADTSKMPSPPATQPK